MMLKPCEALQKANLTVPIPQSDCEKFADGTLKEVS